MSGNKTFQKDFLASIVVFLVALPLCMGISIASGCPPILGLISGIIGGIVIGTFSGAPLQVSGPAAGLAVMVYEVVEKYGLEALAPLGIIVGICQVLMWVLNLSDYFKAISPSLVKGLLSGIGFLILSSQLFVALDIKPVGTGLNNLMSISGAFYDQVIASGSGRGALYICLATLAAIILWDKFFNKLAKIFPPALLSVVVATVIAFIFGSEIKYVSLPKNILNELNFMTLDSLKILSFGFVVKAIGIALVASAETLLSTSAIDRLSGRKSNYNKEMLAQGIGNSIAGFLGALPITGVIVRSSANLSSGAETRSSTILHGIWLILMVFVFTSVLELIPMASLAGVLIFTGWKLLDVKSIPGLIKKSKNEAIIYFVTFGLIVSVDLLTGVVAGFITSLFLLAKANKGLKIKENLNNGSAVFKLEGNASFLQIPKISNLIYNPKFLNGLSSVTLDISNLKYIDWAVEEQLESYKILQEKNGVPTSIQK